VFSSNFVSEDDMYPIVKSDDDVLSDQMRTVDERIKGAVNAERDFSKSALKNAPHGSSVNHSSIHSQQKMSRRKYLLLGMGIGATAMLSAFGYYIYTKREEVAPTATTPMVTATTTRSTTVKANTENMVLIPAGSFVMGREVREGWSPMAAPEMFDDELPPHEVYVDAFYIDRYEVTNRQFKEFVDATGYLTDAEDHGGSMVMVPADQADTPVKGTDIGWKFVEGASWRTPEGPGSSIEELMDHPVVHVSWNDANAYAKWIGKRLPTEAEWEKAARGGTNTNWFWGDSLGEAGKYQNFYAEHRLDYKYPPEVFDGYDRTSPVGSFLPNGYGLYDTSGNVFEWTNDWYQYDYFSHSPRNNPKGPENGDGKVIKGGGWYLCECFTRPANREPRDIVDHDHGLGFRLALDAK